MLYLSSTPFNRVIALDPTASLDNGAGRAGGANAWSIMAVDVERDLLFVPTDSAKRLDRGAHGTIVSPRAHHAP
jgi:hypothetical protein